MGVRGILTASFFGADAFVTLAVTEGRGHDAARNRHGQHDLHQAAADAEHAVELTRRGTIRATLKGLKDSPDRAIAAHLGLTAQAEKRAGPCGG